MTEAVVEKPGFEARFIGTLRTGDGTLERLIGIADTISGRAAGAGGTGASIPA